MYLRFPNMNFSRGKIELIFNKKKKSEMKWKKMLVKRNVLETIKMIWSY